MSHFLIRRYAAFALTITFALPSPACDALRLLATGKLDSPVQWKEAYSATLRALADEGKLSQARLQELIRDPLASPDDVPAEFRRLWGVLVEALGKVPAHEQTPLLDAVRGELRERLGSMGTRAETRDAVATTTRAFARPSHLSIAYETHSTGGPLALSADGRHVFFRHEIHGDGTSPALFEVGSRRTPTILLPTRSSVVVGAVGDFKKVSFGDLASGIRISLKKNPFFSALGALLRGRFSEERYVNARSDESGSRVLVMAVHGSTTKPRISHFSLYDSSTGVRLSTWSVTGDWYTEKNLALSPGGDRVWATHGDSLVVWDTKTGEQTTVTKTLGLGQLAPSPFDGRIGHLRDIDEANRELVVVNAESGKEVWKTSVGNTWGHFSLDGRWMLNRRDGKVWLYDLKTHRVRPLCADLGAQLNIGFRTDSKQVLLSRGTDERWQMKGFDFVWDIRGYDLADLDDRPLVLGP